jgi:hypothetical protein
MICVICLFGTIATSMKNQWIRENHLWHDLCTAVAAGEGSKLALEIRR